MRCGVSICLRYQGSGIRRLLEFFWMLRVRKFQEHTKSPLVELQERFETDLNAADLPTPIVQHPRTMQQQTIEWRSWHVLTTSIERAQ